jgi:short-subunit dehydrogenase
MTRIVIVGATSAIAHAVAREFAARGASFYLVARNEVRLRAVADDLRSRGATRVDVTTLDVLAFERHAEVVESARRSLRQPDAVLIAHGELPDQTHVQNLPDAVLHAFRVNALSTIALATSFGGLLEKAGRGSLTVVSSVAGDRGRASNYVYGAAKGAVDRYLEGLGARLAPAGVRVVTVKPGPIDTPMTKHMTRGLLWSTPGRIAGPIRRAMMRRSGTIYVPWFWRPVMAVLRSLPEFVFRRLPL